MKDEKAVVYPIDRDGDPQTMLVAEERLVDYEVMPHFHDFLEIDFVIGGNGYHTLNGKETPFEKGVIVISRYSDYHYIKPDGELKLLNVSFQQGLIDERIFHDLQILSSRICVKLNKKDFSHIMNLMKMIIAESKTVDRDYRYIGHIIECILIKIMGLDIFKEPLSKSIPMQEALSYIRSHYMEDPPVDEVARMLNYNTKYFSGFFKSEMNMTYSQYLEKLKINYAKTLLTFTDDSVEDISRKCGFGSADNFRHAFKQTVGVSPLKYRKNV